jgi:hypothetical protein
MVLLLAYAIVPQHLRPFAITSQSIGALLVQCETPDVVAKLAILAGRFGSRPVRRGSRAFWLLICSEIVALRRANNRNEMTA